jgi:hypothetical protein
MTKSGIDRYDIEARYVPALVCSVPFLFFGYYFISGLDGAFWQLVLTQAVGSLALTTALYLVAIHYCAAIGKVVENRWFNEGLSFPTTEFLLNKDVHLTQNRKSLIRHKINERFNLDLNRATGDTVTNRRHIHEAVGQIRSAFYRKNHLIQQRNIRFGITKNLLAGSTIAGIMSAFGYLLSSWVGNDTASSVALALFVLYILLAIVSGALIKSTAQQYAYALYDEFIML